MGGLSYRQCIVEVLGILRVYGERQHVAEVLAAGYFLLGDAGFYLVGCLLHALRVLVGQAVLCQYGVHLHVVVALLAQHVDDLAHDVLRLWRRPLRDFHHGLLSRLAALQLLLGYQHVVYEDVTLGHQEGKVLLHLQDADGLVVLAL